MSETREGRETVFPNHGVSNLYSGVGLRAKDARRRSIDKEGVQPRAQGRGAHQAVPSKADGGEDGDLLHQGQAEQAQFIKPMLEGQQRVLAMSLCD